LWLFFFLRFVFGCCFFCLLGGGGGRYIADRLMASVRAEAEMN